MQKFIFVMIIAISCSCGNAQLVPLSRSLKHFSGDRFRKQSNGVIFYIATRRWPNRVLLMPDDLRNIFEIIDLDLRKKTIIIVHGIRSSANAEWVKDLQNALLVWNDLNIISVDWSALGSSVVLWGWFVKAKMVPAQITDFIENISGQLTLRNEEINSIYLIGHSLGAHICGVSANLITLRNLSWTVQRITGLDPARIDVGGYGLPHHLDKSQAPYVDVIHTSMLGIFHPIGHSDFYLNGGTNQPGCGSNVECGHRRAHGYFIESVKSAKRSDRCIFPTYKWKLTRNSRSPRILEQYMCSEMGINSDQYSCTGTFFVTTTAEKPYCFIKLNK